MYVSLLCGAEALPSSPRALLPAVPKVCRKYVEEFDKNPSGRFAQQKIDLFQREEESLRMKRN
jgi:hypothetical protein